ncbi:MAG TPA: alpha/beta fold hydrolase, partial [Pyrinomonadaceae bacterium]
VRLNLRNCGDTEHLAPTLYHAGMSSDLDAVIRELVEKDNLPSIFLAGFSMGGNMTLKLAGEEPGRLPRQLVAVCAVSPSIDLSLCADAIEQRSNWVYKRSFIQSLHRRIRQKQKLFPDLYDTRDLRLVRTIRAFDERYTAIHGGYSDADDYYSHASALPFLPRIAIPSLIVHAIDDPFVPYEPLRDPAIKSNPNIVLLSPEHGGHVGFVGVETQGEDRFWVENRIVEFCQLVRELLAV